MAFGQDGRARPERCGMAFGEVARSRPKRMNSPLEGHEVHLRGLPREGPSRGGEMKSNDSPSDLRLRMHDSCGPSRRAQELGVDGARTHEERR